MKNKWRWIIGLIFLSALIILIYFSFTLRMIGLWMMILLGFISASLMIYSFVGAFTKKKYIKYIVTALIITICIFGYIETHKPPKAVRMKEDVLYILPKNKIPNTDSIYDGSKNDPNLRQLKQDTISK